MRPRIRLALLAALLFAVLPVLPAAATSGPSRIADLAAASQDLRTAVYDAQNALLLDDPAAAAAAMADAAGSASVLAAGLRADPTAGPDLLRALETARRATAAGDGRALAVAHGELWSALVRGAYAETVAAVEAGDAAAAADWLLLRDFRPTTRFARPNADATLAVRGLGEGTVPRAEAERAVRADLLDTYQARLESSLNDLADAPGGNLAPSQAEAVGLSGGYWRILAPAYGEQRGAPAVAEADAAFETLVAAALAGDTPRFGGALDRALAVVQGFRAAPLSEADQARRAGQLLRYLSLVPVEYGRGVKQGEVILDLEIQEAQTFLDGARAAFADLRLPLRERDAAAAAEIDRLLGGLDTSLAEAASRTAIADPAAIGAQTATATERLEAVVPPAWLEADGDADFDVVSSMLDRVVAATAAGQYQQAESSRVEAYAIFETGPEKRLLAFAPTTAQRVEQLFWEGDGATRGLFAVLAERGGVADVRATRQELDRVLTDAQQVLGTGAVAPAAIVFREGLEAVLILASLLASMIGVNRRYKRPLALGAGAALVASAVLFVLAGGVLRALSGYGEKLEAVVSLVAIAVLLLVMNWFFHKVYWTRWIAKHHEHRRRLLIGGAAGQALGFVLLGFTSVFREGAETVLFLQALVLDAGAWIVVQGTLIGLAATAVVGALTLVLQTKLPHKKMLTVTGAMIAAVLVTMVGGAVHAFQVVGWAPIAAIPGLEGMPYWLGVWFGVYPTWQGVLLQIAALGFVVGSYFVAEHAHRRGRPTPPAAATAERRPHGEPRTGDREEALSAT